MIYYDFHIHSALSPCGDIDMTPNNIVNMAALIGLDAIAVSDHNTVGNVKAAVKAGEKAGVAVIPAMEVETAEEVHILTLYPSLESAEYAGGEVYKHLPEIKNRPDIFGEQLLMNEKDEIVGMEERLLISSTTLSINMLFDLVKEAGGLFVPAHVDRHSYSVLTNLGFMPDDLPIAWIEISKRVTDLEAYFNSRPELEQFHLLRNSDAHYLTDISEREASLPCSAEELFDLRRKR